MDEFVEIPKTLSTDQCITVEENLTKGVGLDTLNASSADAIPLKKSPKTNSLGKMFNRLRQRPSKSIEDSESDYNLPKTSLAGLI